MPLTTGAGTFTRWADGSLSVSASGKITEAETAELVTYLDDTEAELPAAQDKIKAEATTAQEVDLAAALAATVAAAEASTEVVPASVAAAPAAPADVPAA
jgi:hypothetical protein